MTRGAAALVALVLYVAGCAVVFGWRSWRQRRQTGAAGFRGISGTPGSAGWWGGVLFVAAVILAAAAPMLELLADGTSALPLWMPVVGLVVTVAGFAGVLLSQVTMGRSWRIGVDAGERTDLVTTGVFAVVRNPVFTAMVLALSGLVLLVPSLASLLALAALITAVQLQVRIVEEPYLRTMHGRHYTEYAAHVGRFVPAVGRLRPQPVGDAA
ncbi:MAG: isoprenylcysteine carboxylmethyltransferase family protein [Cellulomonas sp.]|uniref:methyltransferase family protein n=1 Tax=Cellulomonas sp. TaxID=40001 RepID=UPI0019F00152|nr:isoprenylcysteine carboxylmethyltransferase family protein [Cellulomonas sp.]MBF0688021.1 isoprenylcysteine carboxylmethyltransferase family protein [Cellulomonas sp.]